MFPEKWKASFFSAFDELNLNRTPKIQLRMENRFPSSRIKSGMTRGSVPPSSFRSDPCVSGGEGFQVEFADAGWNGEKGENRTPAVEAPDRDPSR